MRLVRWGVVLGLVVMAGVAWQRAAPPGPPVAAPTAPATYGPLRVTTDAGPLALDDLRGKAVFVYFGYLSCPDICPTTMANLGAAMARLSPEQAARTTALLISLDPERDTVDRLGEYARYFHPSFHGGTASVAEVTAMASDWGVAFRKVQLDGSAMGYAVDHSTDAFLVAPDGRMAGVIAHGSSPDDVASRVVAALEGG